MCFDVPGGRRTIVRVSRRCSSRHARSTAGRARSSTPRRTSRRCCSRSSGRRAAASPTAAALTAPRRSSDPAWRSAPCASASSALRRPTSRVLIEGESGTGKELVGAADSRAESPAQRSVRRGQLRGDRRDAARGRAVRHRRADGDRRARAARQVRARRRRARCFSTKCRTCRRRRRRSCCARFRIWPSNASAASASRRVDTRIIVADQPAAVGLVERGRFRLDLFYRLSGVDVQVPPLRARREDIPRAGALLSRAPPRRSAPAVVDRRGRCAAAPTTGRATCASSSG